MSKPIMIAGTVLRDKDSHYLLVQELKDSAYGLWTIPGGHADEGETPQIAAVRETLEETGFAVRLTSVEPIFIDNDNDSTGNKRIKHAFLAEITGGALTIPALEIMDVQWFSVDVIKEMQAASKMRSSWTVNAILKTEAAHGLRN